MTQLGFYLFVPPHSRQPRQGHPLSMSLAVSWTVLFHTLPMKIQIKKVSVRDLPITDNLNGLIKYLRILVS
jgi:hypothetical protein